jgi:hypothetical protein
MELTFKQNNDSSVSVTITCDFIATTDGEGYWNDVSKEVRVIGFDMILGNDANEKYYNTDLGILYDKATWDDYVDGLIYTDKQFLLSVKKQLVILLGVEAAYDITYSERGMQDDGRVSCDVGDIFEARLRKLAAQTVSMKTY